MYLHGVPQKSKNVMQESQRGIDVVPLRTKEAREKLGKREWRSLSVLERIALATLDVDRDLREKLISLEKSYSSFGQPIKDAGLLTSYILHIEGRLPQAVEDGKRAINNDIKIYKDLRYGVENSDYFFQRALREVQEARRQGSLEESLQSALKKCQTLLDEKIAALNKARAEMGMLPWDFHKVIETEFDEQNERNRAMAKRRGTPGVNTANNRFAYQRNITEKLDLDGYEQTLRVTDTVMDEYVTRAIDAISARLFGKKANARTTYRLAKYLTEIPAEFLTDPEVMTKAELRKKVEAVAMKIANDPEVQATAIDWASAKLGVSDRTRKVVDALLSEEGREGIRQARDWYNRQNRIGSR